MRKIAVVTDSAANLPPEVIERHHIFVVPLLLYMDGREIRDGIDLLATDLYRRMRQSVDDNWIPKTSTPSTGEFLRAYAMAAREAEEIVSIHVSSKLSGTYQVAHAAREMANIPIHVVDSRTAAMGQGFAVLEAARLAMAGADAPAVIQRALDIGAKVRVLIAVERFDYLHRGGHVPGVAAFAGAALKIHPIISVDKGETHVVAAPRSRQRVMDYLLRALERDAAGGRPVHVAVTHADALSDAESLREDIERRFRVAECYITEFTPVIGAHTGPGVIGIVYYVES